MYSDERGFVFDRRNTFSQMRVKDGYGKVNQCDVMLIRLHTE